MRTVGVDGCLLLLLLVPAFRCLRPSEGAACPLPRAVPELDPASKAYLAPAVFHGALLGVRGSAARGLVATYVIRKVHKSASDSRLRRYANASVAFGGRHAACGPRVRAGDFRKDQLYIVYAAEPASSSRLDAVFRPVPQTKKTVRSVRKVLLPGYAKPAKLAGLKGARVEPEKRIRLRCRVEGFPVPWVRWYRDGKRIEASDRIRIRNKRRDSRLLVQRASSADGGRYECRAWNVLSGRTVALSAWVAVAPAASATPTALPYEGEECQRTNYCLNGGTCIYFRSIGELSCHCADGYKGKRCESKDVSPVAGKCFFLVRPAGVAPATQRATCLSAAPKVSVDLDETTRVLQTYWGK
ncbi:protein vein-like isoform X2 [Centruroides vittatus]|uniref:protein vein-like isoform X2 n=1 Tax=Centruroides vittatus TaxID=120091 RepID=UPI00350EC83F